MSVKVTLLKALSDCAMIQVWLHRVLPKYLRHVFAICLHDEAFEGHDQRVMAIDI